MSARAALVDGAITVVVLVVTQRLGWFEVRRLTDAVGWVDARQRTDALCAARVWASAIFVCDAIAIIVRAITRALVGLVIRRDAGAVCLADRGHGADPLCAAWVRTPAAFIGDAIAVVIQPVAQRLGRLKVGSFADAVGWIHGRHTADALGSSRMDAAAVFVLDAIAIVVLAIAECFGWLEVRCFAGAVGWVHGRQRADTLRTGRGDTGASFVDDAVGVVIDVVAAILQRTNGLVLTIAVQAVDGAIAVIVDVIITDELCAGGIACAVCIIAVHIPIAVIVQSSCAGGLDRFEVWRLASALGIEYGACADTIAAARMCAGATFIDGAIAVVVHVVAERLVRFESLCDAAPARRIDRRGCADTIDEARWVRTTASFIGDAVAIVVLVVTHDLVELIEVRLAEAARGIDGRAGAHALRAAKVRASTVFIGDAVAVVVQPIAAALDRLVLGRGTFSGGEVDDGHAADSLGQSRWVRATAAFIDISIAVVVVAITGGLVGLVSWREAGSGLFVRGRERADTLEGARGVRARATFIDNAIAVVVLEVTHDLVDLVVSRLTCSCIRDQRRRADALGRAGGVIARAAFIDDAIAIVVLAIARGLFLLKPWRDASAIARIDGRHRADAIAARVRYTVAILVGDAILVVVDAITTDLVCAVGREHTVGIETVDGAIVVVIEVVVTEGLCAIRRPHAIRILAIGEAILIVVLLVVAERLGGRSA